MTSIKTKKNENNKLYIQFDLGQGQQQYSQPTNQWSPVMDTHQINHIQSFI